MFRTNKLFVDSVASYCSSTAKFTFCVFIFSTWYVIKDLSRQIRTEVELNVKVLRTAFSRSFLNDHWSKCFSQWPWRIVSQLFEPLRTVKLSFLPREKMETDDEQFQSFSSDTSIISAESDRGEEELESSLSRKTLRLKLTSVRLLSM